MFAIRIVFCCFFPLVMSAQTRFSVALPAQEEATALDGRLLIMLARSGDNEPRFQVRGDYKSAQIFGMDVEDWRPGTALMFEGDVFGYPLQQMAELPPGQYYVQALLHKYETFHRKDGHVVKMPMDRGEGQQWNLAPGNLYSKPVLVTLDPRKTDAFRIELTEVIPPIKKPADTKYVKHIEIQSKLLTEFWGRPMFLGAHVLLPEGWAEHPDVRYPVAIYHNHFTPDFGGFRTEPPDPDLKPVYSERFRLDGYNRIVQQEAYDFYKMWTGPDFPRVLAVEIQHPCPFYDDSYAVNSANVGPYGDAIMYELIPEIERRFRGIGEGWARLTYGGSTGGWEALAVQVMYPGEFNGCYAACPDPIDFRAYSLVNIYEDKNAYALAGDFGHVDRPDQRNYLGQISMTLRMSNYLELTLGTKGRSGQQWDIWEAVYSPVGKDGYPERIWDKVSGEINPAVAAYWREHYDLSYILKRDWPENGDKWRGKIHIYCGDMDNYYLNNAVYLAEEVLKSLDEPPFDGEVDYGDRAEHCWNGDHTQPNAISRLRYHRYFIPKWVKEIQERSPEGVDLTSWRY
ncbi:MAG: hypothetical protein H6575_00210 [Lewinellaceae bacterium]|nr:hypothetical protein [Lewinellaceae bacterium]